MRNWLRRKQAAPARRSAPEAEWLEPRLLYSADAGALLHATLDAPVAPEMRVLVPSAEYNAVAATPTADEVRAAYALTPLNFEVNQGQLGEGVDFAASGVGYAVRLGGGGQAELLLPGASDPLRLELVGAQAGTPEGEDLLATRTNSLVGQDASQWATDIANYGSVVYRDVYQGVDIRYHGNQSQLEYDFVVAAGADASQLQLRFHGVDATRIADNGDLVLTVAGTEREVRFQAPVSYQDGANGHEAVESHYAIEADGTVRLVVGEYDHTRTLVVDPTLSHASYFGESGAETALGVAVGNDGSVYVTGQTTSTTGTFATRLANGNDGNEAYVAKFNADLTALTYATRVGGSGNEEGTAITVDAGGNAIVTGWTRSVDFVGTGTASDQGSRSGTQDAFVFKLNANGNALVFSTYFGGTGSSDIGAGVAVDTSGNIFVAGTVSGTTDNAFLNKYTATGNAVFKLQYGGSGADGAAGVAIDTAGNIYVAGSTQSSNDTIVNGAQSTRPGALDGFLVKYDASGTIAYSTYIGWTQDDTITGVAADDDGRAYVIGRTKDPSQGFATTAGALETTATSAETGFLRIYDTTRTGSASLAYSTYIGGTHNVGGLLSGLTTDSPTAVAVNGGMVAIVGTTDTSDFPTTADAYSRSNLLGKTGFVIVLKPQATGSGDLVYGSYYGSQLLLGGAAWGDNRLYTVGSTVTSGLAVGGLKLAIGSGGDGLVAAFGGFANVAPQLAGSNDLPAQLEDTTPAGTLVADLVAGQVSDSDFRALGGIAVTAADSSNGSWQYSLNNGATWVTFATPAAGSALLLPADHETRVRFVPNADANGSGIGLTFRAWDQSDGFSGTVAVVGPTGGSTAFSDATATAHVTVTPVNDVPVRTGTIGTVTTVEGGAAVAIGATSVSYGPGGGPDEANQVLTYTITGLPTGVASITHPDGTPVLVGETFALADLQNLLWKPLTAGTGTVSFTVRDDGGTANGGQDTLAQAVTIVVGNVAPVLTGANALPAQLEDSPTNGTLVADLVAGKLSDPGGQGGIAITAASSSNGSWQYSTDGGGTWTALGTVSTTGARLLAADAVTRVRFVSNANWNGTIASALTFKGWDRSAGVNGGTADATTGGGATAFSTASASSALTVLAVNDAPTATAPLANLSVTEGAAATSLGLGSINYLAGPLVAPFDEFGQTLGYTVTSVPSGIGTVTLADNTTVVVAGNSYTLTQIQGMRFRPGAGVQSGSGVFGFNVVDSGGTANGGADTLVQSLTVTVNNQAPTLTGGNAFSTLVEDGSSNGNLVSDLVAGRISDPSGKVGIAVTAADSSNGNWQFTRDGGSTWTSLNGASAGNAFLLSADSLTLVRFVPAANWNGTATITYRAWDASSGTAGGTADTTLTGGSTAFSSATATSAISVTAVNDAPVRTAGALNNLALLDGNSASLGLGSLAYSPGGGSDEAAQTLTYTVTAVPAAIGQVLLADGTTVVGSGVNYTLAQIQGMQFRPAAGATGSATFSFTVRDNGGTLNGGSDTLTQSLTVRVNTAPTLGATGNPLNPVYEDYDFVSSVPQGNPPPWSSAAQRLGTLVSDVLGGHVSDTVASAQQGMAITDVAGNGTWKYSLDGGNTWTAVTASATNALLLPADTQTRLRFEPATNWNGTATITFRAWDRTAGAAGGRADTSSNGGTTAFSGTSATASLTVYAVNDPPVLTAGAVAPLTVPEGTSALSLGLATTTWGPGGGTDEASQTLSFKVTALPAASFGSIVLADGTAVSSTGSYTLAQVQGMQFRVAAGAAPGTANFGFNVVDNGGNANGGSDTLAQTLAITLVNQAPVLTGANPLAGISEDAVTNNGTLVSDLIAGRVSDAGLKYGIAVTGVDNSHGTWQYTLDGGTTWVAFTGPSSTSARLLDADALTRVRFLPAADWNGSAGLSFVAWDHSTGTAGTRVDASVGGGSTAFSSAGATAWQVVAAVNDPPVRTAGSLLPVSVAEDSGSTSLGLAGLAYGPGGGSDEAGQGLTYHVATLPPPQLGRITLADGTAVGVGDYTLAQLGGMSFVAATDAVGSGSFVFEVRDDAGGSDTLVQMVALTVTPVNDPPVRTAGTVANLRVAEDSGSTSLGLAGLAYGSGGGSDEAGQVLGYTVTQLPPASLGRIVLGDGTAVVAGSYTLADVQGMRFETAANANGTGSFAFSVRDNAGGNDTLVQGLTITVTPVNDPPVAQAGAVTLARGGTAAGSVVVSDVDLPADTLTVALVSGPVHGSLVLNTDGSYSYTHDGTANYSDGFTYAVTDAAGASSQASVSFTMVRAPNHAPVAQAGLATVAEGGAVTAAVAATDADAPLETLTYAVVSGPAHGTLVLGANGSYSYAHDGSETTADSFVFVVTDEMGVTSQASVAITVTPVNDNAPVAAGAGATLAEGGTAAGTVSVSDADLPNDTLTLAVVGGPAHGTLTFGANGSYSYTHDGSENFADGFTYRVTDANGASSQATVSFTITPVNDNAPVAQAGAVTLAEGASTSGSVSATDADLPHDALTYALVNGPSHGTLTFDANGTYSYAHDGSENFVDGFTFSVTDANGATSQAGVSFTVTPVNDNAPVAQASAKTLDEGATVSGAVTASDVDLPHDVLAYALVTGPAHGVLTFGANGSYTYAHDGSENFADGFTFSVTDANGATSQAAVSFTITPVNDNAPVAQASAKTLDEGSSVSGTVSASDVDLPHDALTYAVVTGPLHGTLTFGANGSYTYAHDGSENFTDGFTFSVTDANGATSQAAVSLTISPVNDNAPVAQASANTVDEGATVSGAVTASDVDLPHDVLAYALVTGPAHGVLTFGANGSYTYAHDGSENFADGFIFSVADASGATSQAAVSFTIAPVNDNAPVAQASANTLDEGASVSGTVTASDVDLPHDVLTYAVVTGPAHGTLTFGANGTYSYTHDGSENFVDGFTFSVTDANGATSQAGVSFTVTPVNDNAPVTQASANTLDEGASVSGTVTATDVDLPHDALTYALVNGPAHGTLTFGANGTYSYTHDGSENFVDAFTFSVTDANGATSQAAVSFTISPINDNAPVAQASAKTLDEGASVSGTVTASDVDLPHDVLTYAVVTGPAHGSLTFDANGTYTYAHDGSENFADAFAFSVTDANGATSQAEVTLTIAPINDNAPVAQASANTLDEGAIVSGIVTASDVDQPHDALTYALVNGPSHGTLTFGANGTYTYAHDGSENFVDGFTFEVTDANGATSQAAVSFTITPVNDNAPVAQASADMLDEGASVTGAVTATDVDLPHDALTYAVITGPAYGSLTFNANGTYTYAHDGSENFADGFTFSVTDANGATSQAAVTLTIAPVNDNAPVAQASANTLDEGATISGAVTAADADLPHDALTYLVVTGPAHGTLTFNSNGTYTYAHDGSEHFADGFTFSVADANGATSQAAVTLTIAPVNDNAPIARASANTLDEGSSVSGTVTASDTDLPHDALTYALVTGPAHGTLTFNANGTYTYAHDGSENFADAFTFSVTDAKGAASQAAVTLTIAPVNDNAPVAQASTNALAEGASVSGTVSAIDVDLPHDALTYAVVTGPAHGSLTFNANGTYTYAHDGSENFADGFTFSVSDANGATSQAAVTLTIAPVNDNAPVAQASANTLDEGASVSGAVTATDVDLPHDVLTYAVVTGPAHGTLNFNANGTYTYAHDGSENFADGFTFSVTDANGATSQAAVSFTITPVNDNAPVAQASSKTLDEGSSISGTVTAGDVDLPHDVLTYAVVTGPAYGTLTFGANGTYTYAHDGSEDFFDGFTFSVTDANGTTSQAAVSFTITPLNDNAPVAQASAETLDEGSSVSGVVTASDVDLPHDALTYAVVTGPVHGTLTFNANGTYTYTHDGSENFADGFTFSVTDANGASSQGAVTLAIAPVNDNAPVAQASGKTLDEGSSVSGIVAASDVDLPHDALTYAVVTGPAHGVLTLGANGSYTYAHDGSENFADGFTFSVTDANGATSQAAVSFTITPVNDNAPVAQASSKTLDEGSSISGTVTANDLDLPHDALTYAVVTGPAHGTLTFNANGTYTYAHDGSENFADAFTFSVTDAKGAASQAAVTLTITPVNDNAPVAEASTNALAEGASVSGTVSAIDVDLPHDALTYAVVTGPAHGSLTFNANGTYTYAHDGSENFTDGFTFSATDANGATSQAAVTLTIAPVNDNAPVAQASANTLDEGASVSGAVTATDVDLPHDVLTYAVVTGPAHGTLNFNANGTYTYAHDGSENFADGFTFSVTDANGATSQAAVSFTITPVNDNAPVAQASSKTLDEGSSISGTVTAGDVDLPHDVLTYAVVTGPAYGTLTFGANGAYTYAHDGSENFVDGFTFSVTDANGATSQAAVSFTIAPVNDNAPVAQASAKTLDEGAIVSGTVSAIDLDLPHDALTYAVVTGPAHGSLTFDANGTYTYAHDDSENFADGLIFSVTDANGATSQAAVSFTIAPVNDNAPVAQAGAKTLDEGGSVSGTVTANDLDLPHDALTYAVVTGPAHGTLTFNANGTYTYAHDGSENFADGFTFSVTDANGASSQAAVTLTIAPVNDNAPVAQASANTLDEGASVSGTVSATDVDLPHDALTYAVVTGPAHGTLTFNTNGTYTYAHDGSENFADGFTFSVADANGATSQAAVTLTIAPVNDNAPVAQASGKTLDEGSSVSGSVSATDADLPHDALTYALVNGPSHGTLTFGANGTYTYAHDGSENFADGFTFSVTDANGASSHAAVSFTITPVNDNAPVAQASSKTLDEGTSVSGAVTASDVDLPLDVLTYALVTGPAHGVLTFDANGSYTYAHDGSENFADGFTFSVTDANGASSQAAVTLTIAPVNDNAPVAQASANTLDEGATVSGAVTATDADLPHDALTYLVVTGPAHGTLTFTANGTYTYAHDGSENFADGFTFSVTDANGATSQAAVTLTIAPVNDNAPVAQASSKTLDEGTSVSGTVTASDVDLPNDALTYAVVTGPAHGTLTFGANGTYTYAHDSSESFADAFTFSVTDANGATSQAAVSFTITPVNDNAPVAQASSKTLDEGSSISGTVTAGDVDLPHDVLTYAVVTGPAHGTLTFNANGTYTYGHDGSENFADGFIFSVTDANGATSQAAVSFTVTPVNDNAPVAQASAKTLDEGSSVSGTVTASDVDLPNDALTYAVVTGPVHGTLTFNANGTYTYAHDGSENFGDAFTFSVTDAKGAASQAAVTLTITPVNDNAPVAQASTNRLDEGSSVSGTVTASDVDLPHDALTYAVVTGPAHGTLTFNANGTYTYAHDDSENFADGFTFSVTDASGATSQAAVSFTITPVNDNAPVAQAGAKSLDEGSSVSGVVTASDVDLPLDVLTYALVTGPAHGVLTFDANGSYTYAHDGSENFVDGFTFSVTDASGATSQASVSFAITPVNDNSPVAQASSKTLDEGSSVSGAVTASDVDLPHDVLTYAVVTGPAYGTLTFNANGTYTYVHDGSENFADGFTFSVSDTNGATSQAVVTLTIAPVNDNAPVAQASSKTLDEGTSVSGAVTASDVDLPHDALTYAVVTGPAHGMLTFNANGTYTYAHDGSENFADAFTFSVTDANGARSQAAVTLTIAPVNDNAPVAQPGVAIVAEGGVVAGAVGATDADLPNDALTYSLVTGPAHGGVTFGADGSYRYVHDGSENFADAFTFQVRDANGATSQATVALTITPVNDNAPVASSGTGGLLEGGTFSGAVAASDADLPNDALTYAVITGPSHGALTFNANGTYTYAHDGSENFTDGFTFAVTDANGATSQAEVTLTITPVNDNAPSAQAGRETLVERGSVSGSVSATDADLPNDVLTYSLVSGTTHGTLSLGTDGTYSYTHDGSAGLNDAFVYQVTDASGATSQATVSFTIVPLNDHFPVAQAGTASVAEGGSVAGSVSATDADLPNDTLTFALVAGPVHGTLTFAADGSFGYVHDGSENFTDAFTFQVTDANGASSQAAVTLTITPVNDNAPVAQAETGTLAEGGTLSGAVAATDPDLPHDTLAYAVVTGPVHGTLTFHADGTYSYTHDGSENFADGFTFKVTDANGATSQASVTLTITPVNDNAPVAQAGTAHLPEGGSVAGAVTATDTDLPNDTLTFALVTGPAHGTLTFNPNGTYTYTHDGSENFGDGFTFSVTDANGASSQAAVTLTVTPVNDNAPVAQQGTAIVAEGGTVAGAVAAADADLPNDTLTYALVTGPAHGTLTLGANGSFVYVHDGSETSVDAFTFRVTDAGGASSDARMAITVTPVDDPTDANPDTARTPEDATVAGNVLGNDSDVDSVLTVTGFQFAGDPTVYAPGTTVTLPRVGSLTLSANGDFVYVPVADWAGTVPRVTYTLSTGGTSTLDVVVAPVNDAPVRTSDAPADLTVSEGSGAVGLGLRDLAYAPGGGSDEAGQALTVTVGVLPDGIGRIVLGDGRTDVVAGRSYTLAEVQGMQFVAADGLSSGSGSFRFSVTDYEGATTSDGLRITVVNQAPTLDGANALPAVDADSTAGNGMLVADLIAGHASDPSGHYGIAVVSADTRAGQWEYSRDGGASWNGFDGVSASHAELLTADGETRIRFVPAADWSGEAGGLGFRAWDRSDDTGQPSADATRSGGSSAFSSQVAQATVVVKPAAAPPQEAVPPAPAPAPAQSPAPAPATPTTLPEITPAPAPQVSTSAPASAEVPSAPTPLASEPAPVAVRGDSAARAPAVGDLTRVDAPVTTALLPAVTGFAPQALDVVQDTGRIPLAAYDLRDLRLASFNPEGGGEFAVTGFARLDPMLTRITLDQFQQTLRSGAFIDELNRLRKQMQDEFDIDRTTSITVAGLSLGVSVIYVLWLIRGGVLLGSYLSALPAWRLLDPLPVLARTGDDEDEDDEAFAPADDRGPDPLRGFA